MNAHQELINHQLLTYTKHAAVMKAYVLGEKIQYRSSGSSEWSDAPCPNFAPSLEYRVVPKPKEFWLIYYLDRPYVSNMFLTKQEAQDMVDKYQSKVRRIPAPHLELTLKKFVEEVS